MLKAKDRKGFRKFQKKVFRAEPNVWGTVVNARRKGLCNARLPTGTFA